MIYGYLNVVTSLLIRLSTGCSFNITKASGSLTSPNYPNKYSNKMDCEYVIRSPTKQPITVTFDDFEVEEHSDCTLDYVSVKDGDNTLLGKFCGYKIPPPLLALSGVVIFKFHSDYSVREKGFLAVYNDSQECVYVKKDSSGSIQSPNFPANYTQELVCLYYIESVNRIPINITFTSFDLEYSSSGTCKNDYVMIAVDI
ncbi:neuropilin-2-like [Mytilus trossulus]|uniref:neuropilin-2-like n=1 Tax=Mytilus trossulus TaxID=6551 RepID=UPI0030065E3B